MTQKGSRMQKNLEAKDGSKKRGDKPAGYMIY